MQSTQGGNRSIRSICGNPRWRGDGDPIWIEGRGNPWERPARTAADARLLRDRTVRLLRRHDQVQKPPPSPIGRIVAPGGNPVRAAHA